MTERERKKPIPSIVTWDSNELDGSQRYLPPFDAFLALKLLMSVIIMHPKHNLETKYKKWGTTWRGRVAGGDGGVGREGGVQLFLCSKQLQSTMPKISACDIMRMCFLRENLHFISAFVH